MTALDVVVLDGRATYAPAADVIVPADTAMDGGRPDAPGPDAHAVDAGTAFDAADASDAFDAADVIEAADTGTGADLGGADSADAGCRATSLGDCCGVVCVAPPHAVPACLGGVCGVGACAAGYADCDGVAAKGCESELACDRANCGACGARCAEEARCPAATCMACPVGQVACGDTCANLQADVDHCGRCDLPCNGTNGTASCAAGRCAIRCSTGSDDCDSDPTNGCETSLDVPTHCGRCGNACAAGNTCVDGVCSASPATRYRFSRVPGVGGFVDACAAPGALRVLAAAGDASVRLAAPFPLRYWDVDLPAGSPVSVTSNGWMGMGGAVGAATSGDIPSTIAPKDAPKNDLIISAMPSLAV